MLGDPFLFHGLVPSLCSLPGALVTPVQATAKKTIWCPYLKNVV